MNINVNPNAAAHRPDQGSKAQGPSTATAPAEATDEGVEVAMSASAQGALAAGNAANGTPAAKAHQAIMDEPDIYGGMPFGQVVKQFTPGHLKQAAAAEAAAAAAAAAEAAAAAAAAEAAAAAAAEETSTVDESGETPVEPDAGETTETAPATEEPILAEDGAMPDEAVAADETSETVVETPAEPDAGTVDPVPVADSSDLIDELLEEIIADDEEIT